MLGQLEIVGIGLAALKLQADLPDYLHDRIEAAARDYDRLVAEIEELDQAVHTMANEVMATWSPEDKASILSTFGWN